MTLEWLSSKRIQGVTADTKPTLVPTGTEFMNTQTKVFSIFDGSVWNDVAGGSGGGGGSSGMLANGGTISFSGDSSNKTFNIPHGLGEIPTGFSVEPSSVDALGDIQFDKDITNLIVTYQVAPPTATNNVVFEWMAAAGNTNFILKTVDNAFGAHYQDFTKMTAPANPGANDIRLYVDTADTHLKIRNNAGTVVDLHSAGGSGGDVYLANANVFTAAQKISVDNGNLITFYRPINTNGFGGGFLYNFQNSTPAEVSYGNQYVSIESNTAAAHRGDFNVQLAVAASLGIRFRVFTSGNGGIIIGNNQRFLISETGLTAQRTWTAPDSNGVFVGTTIAQTLTAKTITAPILDSYYDLNRITAPADPGANVARLYHKQKDANNDGIFTKIKTAGAITEVELGVADDVLTLNELADVTIASPAVNHVPTYQTGSATFENKILKTRHPVVTGFSGTASGARYISLFGSNIGSLSTETNIDHELWMALTVKRVRIRISTNGRDSGNQIFTLRKNQADFGGVSHTVAFTATTAYDSGEITASYTAGDDICLKIDNGGTTGTLTTTISVEYEVSAYA